MLVLCHGIVGRVSKYKGDRCDVAAHQRSLDVGSHTRKRAMQGWGGCVTYDEKCSLVFTEIIPTAKCSPVIQEITN